MLKKLILVISLISTSQSVVHDLKKCEDEGCYEVIKTFVELLKEKINETDKILAEAERELNEVTFGNDAKFQSSILELDNRLKILIAEINTGIDGGKLSLFDLINSVFKALNDVETETNHIELAIENGNKITKIADVEFSDLKEAIKKVQEEFSRLQNQTETDLPSALQDAFDRSEKFDSDAKSLVDILSSMKVILAEYEKNVLNAQELTSQALEKFADVTKQIDKTSKFQKDIEEMLEDANDSKLPVHELENVKKLVKDASDKSKAVLDDSLELFNEVSLLELYGKFDDIKMKIKELNDYSEHAEIDLKKFSEENSKFLEEMELTLEKAEDFEKRAKKQQDEILKLLDEAKNIEGISKKAIDDKNEIISVAKNIYKVLEDFNMKIEESRENAQRAFEKIPEILTKTTKSKEIVKNLEDAVEENMKMGIAAKKKCTAAKMEMDKVLEQSDIVRSTIESVADELDATFEKMSELNKNHEENLKSHDNLKKKENKTEDLIQTVKEKVERTKMKAQEVDEKLTSSLKILEELIKFVDKYKEIDPKILEDFETKLDKLEKEIEESQLHTIHKNLKEQSQQQNELIEKYRVTIAMLEHEVKTIKENAESLEDKCFKRTRLEP